LMVVIVVIAIATVLAIKRIQQSRELPSQPTAVAPAPTPAVPTEPPPQAAAATSPASDAAANPVTPSPVQSPAPSPAPAIPPTVTPNKAAAAAAPKTTPPPQATASAANGTAKPSPPSAPAAPAAPGPPQPDSAAPSGAAASPVVDTQLTVAFDNVKLLIVQGDKAHEDDAELRFANGNVQILGSSQQVVGSFPYQSVHTVTSARSRQPRWRGPDGAIVDAKMGGGAFGFLKADKNWVALVTAKATFVFRVEDSDLQNLTRTALQRTGAQLVRLAAK